MHGNILHANTGHFLAFAVAISAHIDDDLDAYLGQGLKTMLARLSAPIKRRSYLGEVRDQLFADEFGRSVRGRLLGFGLLLNGWWRWSGRILSFGWCAHTGEKKSREQGDVGLCSHTKSKPELPFRSFGRGSMHPSISYQAVPAQFSFPGGPNPAVNCPHFLIGTALVDTPTTESHSL